MVCKSNLRGMKFRSLIVSAGGSSEDSGSAFIGSLLVGVVFFPSCLPFMGVMLFPSSMLGNASGGGGASLVPLSPFYVFLSLSPLSSPSPSFSFYPLFFLKLFFFFFLRKLLVSSTSKM